MFGNLNSGSGFPATPLPTFCFRRLLSTRPVVRMEMLYKCCPDLKAQTLSSLWFTTWLLLYGYL